MFDRSAILANCRNVSGRFQGVEFNINKDNIYALLESATHFGQKGTQRDAKNMLKTMEKKEWQVRAGGHEGGLGGGGLGADPNPHITLRVDHANYHLRYRVKNNRIELVEITG